jgi:hypothetical protein
MFDHGFLWGFATIIGPRLLLAALIYGVVMYRWRSQPSKSHTEHAPRNLYSKAGRQERRVEGRSRLAAATDRRPSRARWPARLSHMIRCCA